MARTRRPRGTGSYDKCGDLYRWRIGIYNPVTGKTQYKSIKAKTRAALDVKVMAWKEENGGGDALPPLPQRLIVSRWVDMWLEDIEGKRAATTVTQYKRIAAKYIIPLLGQEWIGKVNPLRLQVFFNDFAKNHTAATVSTVRDCFNSCFQSALKMGVIAKNPVKMVTLPRKNKPELRIIDENEASRLLAVAKSGEYRPAPKDEADVFLIRRNYMIILLALASGMRQGEILGLTWENVHNATIDVKHSLQNLPGARVLKVPKSGNPRTVAIPAAVADELQAWREFQTGYAEKYKGIYNNSQGFVFTNAMNGGVVNGCRFTGYIFQDITAAAGIKGLRFHDLRHFFASSALSRGVPVAAVSEQLGHSSISITYNVYTHVLQRSKDELRVVLDANPLFLKEKEC